MATEEISGLAKDLNLKKLAARLLAGVSIVDAYARRPVEKASYPHASEGELQQVMRYDDVIKALAATLGSERHKDLVALLVASEGSIDGNFALMAAEEIARLQIVNQDLHRERDEARDGWRISADRANQNFVALEEEKARSADLQENLDRIIDATEKRKLIVERLAGIGEFPSLPNDQVLTLLKDMYVIAEADGWATATSGRQVIFRQATDLLAALAAANAETADPDEEDGNSFLPRM